MLGFLNRRISTLAGIIILIIISFAVGAFLLQQMNEIVEIRVRTLERMQK